MDQDPILRLPNPLQEALELSQHSGIASLSTDPRARALELNTRLINALEDQIQVVQSALDINAKLQRQIRQIQSRSKSSEFSQTYIQMGNGICYPRRQTPFFIDKDRNVPKDNEDTIRFGSTGFTKVDVLFGSRGWSPRDQNRLKSAVLRQNKIRYFDKILRVVTKTDEQLLWEVDGLDWEKISKEVGRRTALECQIQWCVNQHPSINQTPLSQEEIVKMLKIAEKHNFRDWHAIATELGNGRVAWHVFKSFHEYHRQTNTFRKWTPEEDDRLKAAVETLGTQSWQRIALQVGTRTSQQCLHRWTYASAPGIVKGKWTEEEDALLLRGIDLYGRGNWKQISSLIPSRTDRQVRERFENILNPDLNRGPWTDEEMQKLVELVKRYGQGKWSKIAKEFETRTDSQCKREWLKYEKMQVKEAISAKSRKRRVSSPATVHSKKTRIVQNESDSEDKNAYQASQSKETEAGPSQPSKNQSTRQRKSRT